jgi:hypothetical protein
MLMPLPLPRRHVAATSSIWTLDQKQNCLQKEGRRTEIKEVVLQYIH